MENELSLNWEDEIWHAVEEVTQYQHVYAIKISVKGKGTFQINSVFLLKKAIVPMHAHFNVNIFPVLIRIIRSCY